MRRALRGLLLVGAVCCAWAAEPVVVDFEGVVPVLPDHSAYRVEKW